MQSIVKDRDDIMRKWEEGERCTAKYSKSRAVGYENLDKILWEWFIRARSKNIQ